MIAHGILGLSVEDLRAYPAWNKVNEAGVNTAMATTLLAEQVRQDAALPRDEYVLVLLCCDEYQELLHARDSKGNPVAEKWTRAVASWAIKGAQRSYACASSSVKTLCQAFITCKQHIVLLICITIPNDIQYACLPKTRTKQVFILLHNESDQRHPAQMMRMGFKPRCCPA